ncbi:MAG: hypothetical protein OXS28_05360 [Gammaproteobacteria bacterium]|nr:hypothetical protein [Gammaproteobacteria bacterium]
MPVIFRIPMLILVVVQLLFTGITAFTGAFADGGQWWEYATVVLLHPLAAIGLLLLVITSQPTKVLITATAVLLLLTITADTLSSFAILFGITRGDWWLPAVFSVIPVIALGYCLVLARNAT